MEVCTVWVELGRLKCATFGLQCVVFRCKCEIYRLKKVMYGLGCVILIKVQRQTLHLKCAHFDVDMCKYWLEVGLLHGLGKLLVTVEKKLT